MSTGRPNNYDLRQMRRVHAELEEALRHTVWMLEDSRPLVDRELRAMVVRYSAGRASRLAKHIEKRFARERGAEPT